MSDTDPYAAPVSSDDGIEAEAEAEGTQSFIPPDQPFAAYGGTAGFIFNILL